MAREQDAVDSYGITSIPSLRILGPDGTEMELIKPRSLENILAALRRHAR